MSNWLISLIVGGLFGLLLAVWVARDSAKEKPLTGGVLARVLHYLACAALVAAAPTGIAATLLYGSLHLIPRVLRASALGFADVAASALLLIGYAAFEANAVRQGRPE